MVSRQRATSTTDNQAHLSTQPSSQKTSQLDDASFEVGLLIYTMRPNHLKASKLIRRLLVDD